MMSHPKKVLTTAIFAAVLITQSVLSAERQPQIQKIESSSLSEITEIRLKSADNSNESREFRSIENAQYQVAGWAIGNELYKSYLDPSNSCPDAYPFRITEINMPMYFASPTSIYVSVDVEEAYYPSAGRPWPGAVLAISVDYELIIPAPGYYDVWIPLDSPVVVHGPFFAGFFLGSTVTPEMGLALLTGGDSTAQSQSYDIWDEQIGFIDLLSNSLWNFPGQLVMGAAGVPQSSQPQQPEPKLTILSPSSGEKLLGTGRIWAHELSGSNIIDYVSFEYSTPNGFVEIGRDYDGSSTLRNGIDNSGDGDGYSQVWNFSMLKEGNYTLRVTAVDSLGRSASDQVTVYVEPSPPVARIISFEDGSDICSETDILMSCSDENMARVSLYIKEADLEYSSGLIALNQSQFGDYYSGPIAVASAIQLWSDRGYSSLMSVEASELTLDELVEEIAVRFKIKENNGTIDEYLYGGLRDFSSEHGNALTIEHVRHPDYAQIRKAVEEEEKATLVAVGGTPGLWLAVDGFTGWVQPDGNYLISVCNPTTGAIEDMPIRSTKSESDIFFDNEWHGIDMMVAIGAVNWDVQRTLLGLDSDGSDGWAFPLTPENLSPDTRYFIRAEGIDGSGIKCASTTIVNYDCSQAYDPGDYDADGSSNLVDLVYLTEFVTSDGEAPVGGAWRGDANGDTHLNITDLVYYLNYLYGVAGPPRY